MSDRRGHVVKAMWLACLTMIVSSSGCFGLNRGAPPLQHYVLGGGQAHPATEPAGDSVGLSIGLRRVQMAPYLDAPFMVVRLGPHQVEFSEFHRWGEDLGSGINRTVAGYLSGLPGYRAVDVAPWAPHERYDYLIQLRIERFEGVSLEAATTSEGEVHVLAAWDLIRQEGGEVLTRGRTDHRVGGWTVGDHAGLVTLLDAGLGVLSDDLAAAVANIASATR